MIYLDYNATTPVLPEVREAMMPYLTSEWGNPSSAYRFGARAKAAIEKAREQVASLVNARPDEVIFTSCATEANNAAIHSALMGNPAKRHVVTSQVEHSSVLHYCQELERRGYDVTYLSVSRDGLLNLDDLERAIRPDTGVVSLMWANNETGVIWPVQEIGEICMAHGIPYHCDAVQAIGKVNVDFILANSQALTISGHKIGAPKGVGAVIVRRGMDFHPLIVGGRQERGYRGGTENVSQIVGLGIACNITASRIVSEWCSVSRLRDQLENELIKCFPTARINGNLRYRLPNTSNISVPGIDSDAFVTFCDRRNICISSGSACLQSAITPSHVVYAMSGDHARASESIRVSLGLKTQACDVAAFLQALHDFPT